MGKKINPAVVGMFVLGAAGLLILSVALFGSGRMFQKTYQYVTYFSGSVNGLRVGAPVKFQGVEIGQVSRIMLKLEEAEQPGSQISAATVRIPVVIELDEKKIVRHGGTIDLNNPDTVPTLIKEGLRAQLGMDSFVTGLLYVALVIEPTTPIKMSGPPGLTMQEIPTVPTALEEAQSVATRIIERLDKIDFGLLMTKATDTLMAINQLANSPALKQSFNEFNDATKQLNSTLGDMRVTLDHVNRQIDPLADNLKKTTRDAGDAMVQAKETLGTVKTTIQPGSPLNYQAVQTLQDVSAAARSLKNLADLLQRNPSSVVRGRDLNQGQQ
ncbi:MAG TPA: MlaD family protein [Candidatus Binataceae bacterium]|nr:MlaD family protein [Candidatus Binataceae bacterium]